MIDVVQPFRFHQLCRLTELTGLEAHTVRELRAGIAHVDSGCIFYHTHHSFLRAHRVANESVNDFARWVAEAVQAYRLAERLGGVDVLEFANLEDLRALFLRILDEDIHAHGAVVRNAPPGEPFHFVRARTFVYPLELEARTAGELAEGIEAAPPESIFFHLFEARLRLERGANDFSLWLETQAREPELATAVARIDPYVLSLDDLRERLVLVLRGATEARPRGIRR